jgi:tetratricopeptide (TPR) repeat protein
VTGAGGPRRSGPSRPPWGRLALLATLAGACATGGPAITKLVNGRLVVTRSVGSSAYEHVARGLILEEEERWNDAAAELQRALVYDGDAPELQAHLAELFMRLDRLEDAAAAVRTSLAVAVTVDGLVAEAHLRQLRGDPAGAVGSLERAVPLVSFAEDPAQAEGTALELGEAALLALDAGRARRAYQALCDAAPASLTGRLRLAAVAWAMGDLGEAERRLLETLGEEPNQLDALITLAGLYGAMGRSAEARARYRDALDRSEGAPDMAIAYARYLMAVGDKKEAEQLADDLPPLDVRDLDSLVKRVELARVTKQFARASASLDAASQGDPPDEIKIRLPILRAQVLADGGNRPDAVKSLLAIGKDEPAFFDGRLQAAELLREDGKTDEAARAIAEGEVNPEDDERSQIELVVARAQIDERRGDAAHGARRLEEAMGAHHSQARLAVSLAALEERRGRWQRALQIADKVLAREPGNVEALNFWGFVAADHDHDLPRAQQRLVSALSLDPGTGSIIDSVGWGYLKAGDLRRAALFLEQAARLDPEDPEVLSHMGALYVKQSQPERASVVYRKALGLRPEDGLRRRMEEELSRLESRKAARP